MVQSNGKDTILGSASVELANLFADVLSDGHSFEGEHVGIMEVLLEEPLVLKKKKTRALLVAPSFSLDQRRSSSTNGQIQR